MSGAMMHENHSKVFVGNLPFKTSNADLEALFRPYGEIIGVSIRKDRMTNKPKGFGFVSFSSLDAGPSAIAGLHGQSFQGRPLTVSAAEKRGSAQQEGDGDDVPKADTSWKTVPTLPPSSAAAGGGAKKAGAGSDAGNNGNKSWGNWARPPPPAAKP